MGRAFFSFEFWSNVFDQCLRAGLAVPVRHFWAAVAGERAAQIFNILSGIGGRCMRPAKIAMPKRGSGMAAVEAAPFLPVVPCRGCHAPGLFMGKGGI